MQVGAVTLSSLEKTTKCEKQIDSRLLRFDFCVSSASVLDLNAFERQNKAEGLGMVTEEGSSKSSQVLLESVIFFFSHLFSLEVQSIPTVVEPDYKTTHTIIFPLHQSNAEP